MYIDSLALERLEEGGLPSYPSQDAQNRIHTQSESTTALASIKHHWLQHLHLPNIDHSRLANGYGVPRSGLGLGWGRTDLG
jgi:hypothetical protein